MKLDKTTLSIVPIHEWGPYISLPLPDKWAQATSFLDLKHIERIAWTAKYILCAEFLRGDDIKVFREDMTPDNVFVNTNLELKELLGKRAEEIYIASCGCCMTLPLKKE